jgi:hypothetical protein
MIFLLNEAVLFGDRVSRARPPYNHKSIRAMVEK